MACAIKAALSFERALALYPARVAGRASIGHDLATLYRALHERTGDDAYAQAGRLALPDLLRHR